LTYSNRACIELEQNQNCSNNWRTEIVLLDLLLSTLLLLQYLIAVFVSFQFKKWFYSYTSYKYRRTFIYLWYL